MASSGMDASGGLPKLWPDGLAKYVVPIVFLIIFVIGLVGNGSLIYIVAKHRALRNIPNIFILSLAIGDLLLILVAVPFSATTIFTFTYWPYGLFICKVNEFMQTLSLGVSVFTLVALSVERYVAIIQPMNTHAGAPALKTALFAIGIWILSGSLATMDLVNTQIAQVPINPNSSEYNTRNATNSSLCKPVCLVQSHVETDSYARFRTMFRFSVYFIIPVLVICTCYVMMSRILVMSSRSVIGEHTTCNQARRQQEARRKVAKVVLSLVVIFIVCWLPYYIYCIWFYFLPGDFNNFWLVFKVTSFCLAFSNSCVNPFALYFLSKQFRGFYDRYLFCYCRCNQREHECERPTTLYRLKYGFRVTTPQQVL